jgi:hypothetical protein
MGKHVKEINVGYDNSAEARIPVNHRRAKAAFGTAAILGGMYLAGHAGEGHQNTEGPLVGTHAHDRHADTHGSNQGAGESGTVTYVVKNGENPGSIAEKLTDNSEDFQAMVKDIQSQEVTPNILPVKQELNLNEGQIDDRALENLQNPNSAGH